MALSYGKKAGAQPSDTSEAELYACPASTELIGKIVVTNVTATAATFRLAVLNSSGSATGSDWIVYDLSIEDTTPIEERTFKVTLAALQAINIQSGTSSALSYVLDGLEKS